MHLTVSKLFEAKHTYLRSCILEHTSVSSWYNKRIEMSKDIDDLKKHWQPTLPSDIYRLKKYSQLFDNDPKPF